MSKPRVELKRGETNFVGCGEVVRGAGDPGILIFWGLLMLWIRLCFVVV